MGNNLKKIRGLTSNRELNDRIGVAMFMYARDMDLEGEETPEKSLARWAMANPMVADQMMTALVATDTEVIESSTEVEADPASTTRTANPNVPQAIQGYTPPEVSVEEVSDDVISASVEANWSKAAQRFAVPAPVDEHVVVTNGDSGLNPFLAKGGPSAPVSSGSPAAHAAEIIKKPEK